jgi:hypothetical protein|nr:MAG TPA: hypothetical protein [Caudoviricetes sp.]
MLKQLIQLFAEKFLVSKKEWLFKNSFSFKGTPITVADQRPGTAPITYTAPSNGLLRVRYQTSEGNNSPLSCYCFSYGGDATRWELPAINGWSTQYSLYVSKGEVIKLDTNNQTAGITGVWFYPSP